MSDEAMVQHSPVEASALHTQHSESPKALHIHVHVTGADEKARRKIKQLRNRMTQNEDVLTKVKAAQEALDTKQAAIAEQIAIMKARIAELGQDDPKLTEAMANLDALTADINSTDTGAASAPATEA